MKQKCLIFPWKGFLIVSLLLLFSCSNKLFIPDSAFQKKNLPFISDSVTTREEIMLKLGMPQGSYENGRILTYRLGFGNNHELKPIEREQDYYYTQYATDYWRFSRYSLVLVFNDENILVKHSLLEVNP